VSKNDIDDEKITRFPDENISDLREKLKQQLNSLPEDLKETNYIEVTSRPWGLYYVLESKNSYKVKKIVVNPKSRLSLQSHKHRSEHWIVVSGTATIEVRDTQKKPEDWIFDLLPNQSCYINANTMHRIANNGKIPLVFIEVQVGEYTGEDDIERYEDDYGRIE
jgi:mannose-1-phosphate guanylyltransferase